MFLSISHDASFEYRLLLSASHPKDKDILLDQEYYAIILDEAHNIKNPRAKATQIYSYIKSFLCSMYDFCDILKLKAKHGCLNNIII